MLRFNILGALIKEEAMVLSKKKTKDIYQRDVTRCERVDRSDSNE